MIECTALPKLALGLSDSSLVGFVSLGTVNYPPPITNAQA
jgi:hypothetical protein